MIIKITSNMIIMMEVPPNSLIAVKERGSPTTTTWGGGTLGGVGGRRSSVQAASTPSTRSSQWRQTTSMPLSVRKRASVRTEREKALSRLRSRPQPGALTLRISQENSIFSSSRKRRMGSLFSSPRTSCLDPFLIDHFPLLTSQGSVRRGL